MLEDSFFSFYQLPLLDFGTEDSRGFVSYGGSTHTSLVIAACFDLLPILSILDQ